jgi:Skp family chaperone for outer membrane proteins
VSRQRESKMKKATYEQLVTVAAEFAENNNCSYALAAKLYKVAKGDVLAFQGAVR